MSKKICSAMHSRNFASDKIFRTLRTYVHPFMKAGVKFCISRTTRAFRRFILVHGKFLRFDWLRAVVFQLNLKYLHVKITNLVRVVV